jgi:hypothetical protein
MIEGELESARKETELVKAALAAERNLHAETKQQQHFIRNELDGTRIEL